MSETFSRHGRQHYCYLFTALVEDKAIAKGIITPKNMTPVMFLYFSLAREGQFVEWITDSKGNLKEHRWLQTLNVLIEEQVFTASTKSQIANHLFESCRWQSFTRCVSLQTAMTRPIRPRIRRIIINNLKKTSLSTEKC